jgi:hypothetical protein
MARLVRHPGQQTSIQGISASMAALMLGDHIPLPRRERGIPFRHDMHRFVAGSLLGRSFLHVCARPVYREVKLIKETAAAAKQEPSDVVAIVSYDEKPGIQAIANAAPDLPLEPGRLATFGRDLEYKHYGTVSLLGGIDLLTRQVHALVRDRHRSREFIEFLQLLDAAYLANTRPS